MERNLLTSNEVSALRTFIFQDGLSSERVENELYRLLQGESWSVSGWWLVGFWIRKQFIYSDTGGAPKSTRNSTLNKLLTITHADWAFHPSGVDNIAPASAGS
jgi:hypothetical protein